MVLTLVAVIVAVVVASLAVAWTLGVVVMTSVMAGVDVDSSRGGQ